jgi:hypothetical protein
MSRMEERYISLAEISLLIADPDLTIAQGPKWISRNTWGNSLGFTFFLRTGP